MRAPPALGLGMNTNEDREAMLGSVVGDAACGFVDESRQAGPALRTCAQPVDKHSLAHRLNTLLHLSSTSPTGSVAVGVVWKRNREAAAPMRPTASCCGPHRRSPCNE